MPNDDCQTIQGYCNNIGTLCDNISSNITTMGSVIDGLGDWVNWNGHPKEFYARLGTLKENTTKLMESVRTQKENIYNTMQRMIDLNNNPL